MLNRTRLLLGAALLGGCASQPEAPPPEPPAPEPAVIEMQPEAAPAMVEAPPPDAPQKPQQTDAGRFRISIAAVGTAEAAAPWLRKAEAAGYRTELLAVEIEGKSWQRVLLPGYATLEEARAALPFVEEDLGVQDAWVTSRRRAPAPAGEDATAAPAATN